MQGFLFCSVVLCLGRFVHANMDIAFVGKIWKGLRSAVSAFFCSHGYEMTRYLTSNTKTDAIDGHDHTITI